MKPAQTRLPTVTQKARRVLDVFNIATAPHQIVYAILQLLYVSQNVPVMLIVNQMNSATFHVIHGSVYAILTMCAVTEPIKAVITTESAVATLVL